LLQLLDRLLQQGRVVLDLDAGRPVERRLPGRALFNSLGLFFFA
jgi:hypothetical protein